MNKKHLFNKFHFLFSFLIIMIFSCNNEFEKVLTEQDKEDIEVVHGKPRVLLIITDGARGESVKDADIPNMTKLLPNSIYSWNALSEEDADNVLSNWTNIFTGVNYQKHGVFDADFSNNKLNTFPLVFDRIKEFDPDSKMKVISSNKDFLNYFAKSVEGSEATSDQDVKNKTVQALIDKDITFLTAHFQDVMKAGESAGYDNSFPVYQSAIEQFDVYVGEIMKALQSRTSFSEENWLIIITSSQGGEFEINEALNDNTIFSNAKVNSFTILHSAKYVSKFIGKPYIGNKFIGDFINFKGEGYAELIEGDNSLYNLGIEDFTIELKIKKNKGNDNNYKFSYPSIMGKRAHWQGSWDKEQDGIGWVIHLSSESWIFNARGTKGTGEVKADKDLNRGTWNTITVTGRMHDGERKVALYTNGELSKEADITGWGAIDSDAKFRIGFLPTREGWRSDAYVADVKIWKVYMSAEVIQQYSCEVGVDPMHPYIDYLAGHWPIMSESKDVVYDDGPFGSHLVVGGADLQVNRLNDYLCAPSSDDLGAQAPRTIDISTQIISWLKVPRQIGWQLDGRVWLDK